MKKKQKEEQEEVQETIPTAEEGTPEAAEQEEKETKEEEESLSPEEEWKAKYNEMNDKFLRLYSEFDNFRKRTQKEKLELYKNANEDLLLALLPVVDDFERADKSFDPNQDTKSVKEGVDLIYQKLLGILKQKGLTPIESPVGKAFDLELQEAITRIPAPSKDLKGKVIDEVEKGYQLNDKVIRFSKVVVGE